LNVPAKAGSSTLRDQLLQVEKQTGKRPKELDSVKVPEGFRYLFELFFDVRSGITDGMNGSRLTWNDLVAFQEVCDLKLDMFEIEALMAMDATVRNFLAKKAEK
jgi:hypothetical protein